MLARSSGMAWHGAEIPPIPCNIHSGGLEVRWPWKAFLNHNIMSYRNFWLIIPRASVFIWDQVG
jgi:hypothetical protein